MRMMLPWRHDRPIALKYNQRTTVNTDMARLVILFDDHAAQCMFDCSGEVYRGNRRGTRCERFNCFECASKGDESMR